MTPAKPRLRPRRRKRQLHPLAISAILIFAVLFITYYAFHQGLPLVHRYTLHAVVSNSVNVRLQSPVRIAGVNVGEVESTEPDGEATRINFTIQSNGLPIHRDATVTIRDRLFLEGGYYLQLNPGTPSAPVVHDGFTIPLQNTSTPVQFYKVLSLFNSGARSDLENALNSLNTGFSASPGGPPSDSGAGGLKRAIPQLTPLLKDVSWVSQGLHGTQAGDVERLLSSGATVTGALNAEASHLVGLIRGLNETSSALAASDGALAQSIAGLDQTLQVSPTAFDAIDRSLPPLRNLAAALTPTLRVSPPLVQGVTDVVDQFNPLITPDKRGALITAFRTTLSSFPHVLVQLEGALPVTKPVADCLRTHVVPMLKETVPDGALSTGRPMWQDFVHFLPLVAGASGNFDANGPSIRVLAGVGTSSLTGGVLGTLNTVLGTVTNLVGIAPGGSPPTGARPTWVGQLRPSAFRPDVSCASQPLPGLAATGGAEDLRAVRTPAPPRQSHSQLVREIAALETAVRRP
jgi:phospholipid/cholesterol/gamma-HCH transport system substrate-binding protein